MSLDVRTMVYDLLESPSDGQASSHSIPMSLQSWRRSPCFKAFVSRPPRACSDATSLPAILREPTPSRTIWEPLLPLGRRRRVGHRSDCKGAALSTLWLWCKMFE